MNSYDLSRNFWNWAFDNPEKISPNHAAVYFFAVEHCNRLGWKKKFGFPSQMTMDAIGIKKHSTYIRYFNDLIEFGFFELIQKSSNQYSSNIISLTIATPKKGEAMDKAIVNHVAKQKEYKQTSKQETKKQIHLSFDHLSITVEDHDKLLKKHSLEQVDAVYNDIENYAKNKIYKSLYRTAIKWLRLNDERNTPEFTDPSLRNPYKDLGK